jgi:MFS transporter, DHA3 family, macrolide efflux protein
MHGHPYLELLRDRDLRRLWTGLAFSALGSEVYRVGAIWLAVSLDGAAGSYLAAAQMTATLLVSLFGGAFVELVSRRSLLIGSDVIRATFLDVVLAAAMIFGLSLPLLILASVVLAAVGALFGPTLQSSLPQLVPELVRIRAVNGLFDATTRSAQVLGPPLAAMLIALLPAAHLLTVNGLSFLASAGAIALMGQRLEEKDIPPSTARVSVRERLALGVRTANLCPGAWRILLTTMVRGAGVALGFSVGIPLLFAQQEGGGIAGISAVALVFGAAAAGELCSNVVVASVPPKRPWRALFLGYATIGAGQALIGAAAFAAPPPLRVPLMVLFALLIGFGNAVAGMQMTTFFGSRLGPGAFAGVLRLRLALITTASILVTAIGPWVLESIGTAWTIFGSGVVVAAVAAISLVSPGRDRLVPVPRNP